MENWQADAAKAIVKVGGGRGFIVQKGHHLLVLTAAHCLPHFPPCHGASYTQERTYVNLLGAVNAGERTVWAECLFADPVADVAVLGEPDVQVLFEQCEQYETLVEGGALEIGDAPPEGMAWLYMLDGSWGRCAVKYIEGPFALDAPFWIERAEKGIHAGMSGSPIMSDDGKAIGIVCLSGGGREVHTSGGPNPRLASQLPGWLLS